MGMIQEYERLMAKDAAKFDYGMQGYVFRADQAGLSVQGALGIAASNGKSSTSTSSSASAKPALPNVVSNIDSSLLPPPGTPFSLVNSATFPALSLEPTEQTREHSVYLKVTSTCTPTSATTTAANPATRPTSCAFRCPCCPAGKRSRAAPAW